jgi:hypothetical protein
MVGRTLRKCLGFFVVWPLLAQAEPAADAEAAAAVQTHLGLFLTTEDRREASELVTHRDERLEIWFLRTVGPTQRDAAVCDGARWLLTGRLEKSTGARGLFAALPGVDEVVLVFYKLETRVKPDAQGRYQQVRDVSPEARFTLSRDKALQLDPATLRGTLVGDRCASLGVSLLDGVWTP